MTNFAKRTITGILFVAVLLGAILMGSLPFAVLFFIITLLGLWEFYTLSKLGPNLPLRILGTVIGGASFLGLAAWQLNLIQPKWLALLIPLFFLPFFVELYRNKEVPFRNLAYTYLGIVYVAIPFTMLFAVTHLTGTYNPHLMIGFFVMLWASDSGAYLAGSAMGKNKLFPRISPGKTWEGSLGGGILSLAAAFILHHFYPEIALPDWLVLSIILVVVGTLGDLIESMFKRSKNIKDSGRILPGHGGILDRFDSLIMATPFILSYLILRLC